MSKIAFCLGSMDYGGAQRVIANLGNYFAKKDDVMIIVTKPGKPRYELNKAIKYFILDDETAHENILRRTLRRMKKLQGILEEERPDVVVSFLPEPSFRVLLLKKKISAKVIVSVRNDPNEEYGDAIRWLLSEFLYPKANGFVFQTKTAQRWFSKRIQKKSVVIPNPINEAFLGGSYAGRREKRIVTAGRLVEQKNQKLLIEAFARIHDEYKDYTLEIYGDGPLKNELQNFVKELKLEDSVKFMGEVSDLNTAIRKAKMFVLSSNYEGMPNALMEAMAMGISCISTNSSGGGAAELIGKDKNGLLVPVNDLDALCAGMKKILDNDELAKKISGAAVVSMKKYGSETINAGWEKYITKIISEVV